MNPHGLPNHSPFERVRGVAKHGCAIEHKAGVGAASDRLDWRTLLTLVRGFFANRPMRLAKRPYWSIPSRSKSVLLILNIVLVALIAFEHAVRTKSTATVDPAPSLEANDWPELALPKFHMPSRELFDVISNRPLFSPSRRKIIIDQPLEVEEEEEDITIELLGTLLTATQRAALVRLGTQEKTEWVREREYVSSWKVEKILAKRLRLRRMDELRIIDLWPETENHPS